MDTFESLLDMQYGKDTSKRRSFEKQALLHMIGEMIREARVEAGLTQEELAEKIGTRKTYISRIENGKSDIRISGLFRIFEEGLQKKLILYTNPAEN